MNEGFLSRWSRLKKRTGDSSDSAEANVRKADSDSALPATQVNTGPSIDAIPPDKFLPWAGVNPAYQKNPGEVLSGVDGSASGQTLDASHTNESSSVASSQTPLPDIASLNMASDFKPFMQANVSAESRNAALKKLFADPSFNVMDGLDTYVADYSQPDPIPAEMLKELLKSKAFCLFDDPVESDEAALEKVAADASLGDVADSLELDSHKPDSISTELAGREPTDPGQQEADPDALETDSLNPSSPSKLETPGPRVAPPPEPQNEKQKGELGW